MFLSLDSAITEIKSLVENGLGPVMLLTDGGSKMSAWEFGIDFGVQIISTILLFIAVRVFLWKPITNILEARRAAIDKELADAEAAKQNAVQIETDLAVERDQAKQKIKEMLDKAEKEANLRRDQIISDAQAEAKRRLDNVDEEIRQEKASIEKEIRNEIVEVAFLAASKIVGKEVDQSKYLDVVDDILKGDN